MRSATLRTQADSLDRIAAEIVGATSLDQLDAWIAFSGADFIGWRRGQVRGDWGVVVHIAQTDSIAHGLIVIFQEQADALRRMARVEEEGEAA